VSKNNGEENGELSKAQRELKVTNHLRLLLGMVLGLVLGLVLILGLRLLLLLGPPRQCALHRQ
jgi:hypothetical protein